MPTFLIVLILLVGLPVLELFVASEVVDQIGAGPALLIWLAATVLGVLVIRWGWRLRPRSADTALVVSAGALLLLPGYLSDVLGLLLLLPPVRALLRVWIGQRVERRLASWNLTVLRWDDRSGRLTRTDLGATGDTIQGEVVPDEPPINGELGENGSR
jgi:UPF0716 protein FxsA